MFIMELVSGFTEMVLWESLVSEKMMLILCQVSPTSPSARLQGDLKMVINMNSPTGKIKGKPGKRYFLLISLLSASISNMLSVHCIRSI